jgi:hypothetical protein
MIIVIAGLVVSAYVYNRIMNIETAKMENRTASYIDFLLSLYIIHTILQYNLSTI